MSSLKAIETTYKGYRFRSRTEARWAVFFDAMKIEWVYESEGFDLGDGGWYLPDFWFPRARQFAEIKGQGFSPDEKDLCMALAVQSGHAVLMFDGQPESRQYMAAWPSGKFAETPLRRCKDTARKFNRAIGRARSARFEHGESGA